MDNRTLRALKALQKEIHTLKDRVVALEEKHKPVPQPDNQPEDVLPQEGD